MIKVATFFFFFGIFTGIFFTSQRLTTLSLRLRQVAMVAMVGMVVGRVE
jgi:hypothetical protein